MEDGCPFGGGWRPLGLVPVVAVMKEGNRFRELEEAVPNEGFRDGRVVRKVVCRKGVEVAAVAVVIVDLSGQRRYQKLPELEDSVVGGEDVCEDAHLVVEGLFRFEDFAGHEFAARFLSHKMDLSITPFTDESQKVLLIFVSLRKKIPAASFGCLQIAIKSDGPDFLDGFHFWLRMGLSDFFHQAIVSRSRPA